MKFRVLFLCANNGVQSPMAEALLNRLDSKNFEALSAGIDCGPVHPLTVEVMKEIGIDLEGKITKTTQDLIDRRFDFVITLCERARLECATFHEAERVHWQFEDPLAPLDHTKRKRAFQSLRDQVAQRVRLFALVQVRFGRIGSRAHHNSSRPSDLVHS